MEERYGGRRAAELPRDAPIMHYCQDRPGPPMPWTLPGPSPGPPLFVITNQKVKSECHTTSTYTTTMSSSSILRQLAASTSRRAVSSSSRAFSSSVRRQEHYLNANQEVRCQSTFARGTELINPQLFDKITSASHTKDRVVLVDFYAEFVHPLL